MSTFPTTNVYTMEEANLFCGAAPQDANASNHLTLSELQLPGIEEAYVDHRPGGGPVAIEISTIINRLESTFLLLGWTPQVMELMASWSAQQNQFTAYGAIRDRSSGEVVQAVASMVGRLGRSTLQNWRRGDLQHGQYSIRGIVHYGMWMGGEEIYYWDFATNILRVGGVAINGDINAALFIPGGAGASVTTSSVVGSTTG